MFCVVAVQVQFRILFNTICISTKCCWPALLRLISRTRKLILNFDFTHGGVDTRTHFPWEVHGSFFSFKFAFETGMFVLYY